MEQAHKPRVAAIMEPEEQQLRATTVLLAYMAREYLSMAEREAENREPQVARGHAGAKAAMLAIEDAKAVLKSCLAMLRESQPASDPRSISAEQCLERAMHASEATLGHIRLCIDYDVKRPDKTTSDRWEHFRLVWRRSAQHARQESHRALTELCELFPEAYEIDEDLLLPRGAS